MAADKDKENFDHDKALAIKGDRVGQYNLGWAYSNGRGVKQDFKEGVKWYRKAAEQGDAAAQYNLGVMYSKGRGVEKDDKEAVKWFRKAAEQGHARAQYNLGAAYRNGDGALEDNVTAYAWYNIAVANGERDHAKKNKGKLTKEMTAEQITKAEALAKEMIAKNPKLIKKKE